MARSARYLMHFNATYFCDPLEKVTLDIINITVTLVGFGGLEFGVRRLQFAVRVCIL